MSFFEYKGKNIYFFTEGDGSPVLLLHGNTASSAMFDPLRPMLARDHTVICIDFLGCGHSDRLSAWPTDLWYEWGKQAAALIKHLQLSKIDVIGCSGGALAALNLALENPELVKTIVADSFEGIRANSTLTDQIRLGRSFAKQSEGFRAFMANLHGEDWEQVFDADTDAVARHAADIEEFFHRPLYELRSNLILTGSAEDEMFPAGHYESLFTEICSLVPTCEVRIFEHGGHPAALSGPDDFIALFRKACG